MDSAKGAHVQMSIDVSYSLRQAPCEPVLRRQELVDIMSDIVRDLGVDHYLIIQCMAGRANETSRILVSNWIFDALEAVGQENLARLTRSHLSTQMGMRAHTFGCDSLVGLLSEEAVAALSKNGHRTFASQQLRFGQARYGIVFSASSHEALDPQAVSRAQLTCCYALSQIAPDLIVECGDPLSERERECLRWVSEGKTTDEVAVILGVSSNTVNSYVTNAIQKLSASNRAMAMATAIRNGLI
jgi:DNA-binding CsgD family transcriptional regulator